MNAAAARRSVLVEVPVSSYSTTIVSGSVVSWTARVAQPSMRTGKNGALGVGEVEELLFAFESGRAAGRGERGLDDHVVGEELTGQVPRPDEPLLLHPVEHVAGRRGHSANLLK